MIQLLAASVSATGFELDLWQKRLSAKQGCERRRAVAQRLKLLAELCLRHMNESSARKTVLRGCIMGFEERLAPAVNLKRIVITSSRNA
jgi:hypothetical protein